MARLHQMVETRVELRVGRNYNGDQEGEQRTWRIEIVDQASLMRIGLIELTDAQFGQVLGGSPIPGVFGEFIDPAKADRIGQVQYQARAVLDTSAGRLARTPYEDAECLVEMTMSEHFGASTTVYAKRVRGGISLTVYGYARGESSAAQQARLLLHDLKDALQELDYVAVSTASHVSGGKGS